MAWSKDDSRVEVFAHDDFLHSDDVLVLAALFEQRDLPHGVDRQAFLLRIGRDPYLLQSHDLVRQLVLGLVFEMKKNERGKKKQKKQKYQRMVDVETSSKIPRTKEGTAYTRHRRSLGQCGQSSRTRSRPCTAPSEKKKEEEPGTRRIVTRISLPPVPRKTLNKTRYQSR